MSKTLTILTPTYNRAKTLFRLYESLENQTVKDFEWFVVDDGSSDDTENIIEEFISKASFPINYKYKMNGGKHTAINVGIKDISTDLVMIVDSDDLLLVNAVEEIIRVHKIYKNRDDIGVYSFLKCYSNGNSVVKVDKNEFVDSYIKYRIKQDRPGDMAEVFKTIVLKEYPFPEFKGEKFLSEDVVWIQIGLKYLFLFLNINIYQCEYLEGGLTSNDKRTKFNSPIGSMMRGKMLMNKECGFKQNIKGAIIYNCYKLELKSIPNKKIVLSNRERILVFITKLLGYLYNYKWKSEIK